MSYTGERDEWLQMDKRIDSYRLLKKANRIEKELKKAGKRYKIKREKKRIREKGLGAKEKEEEKMEH